MTSNTALTDAFDAPFRTTSRVVLYPKTAPIASMMIDFPAPVSPVNTLKPYPNSMSQLSITAIFSMWRSLSIDIHS